MRKLFAFASIFMTLASANAEVKPDGTVLETACASAKESNPTPGGYLTVEFCEAQVEGVDPSVIYFTSKEEQTKLVGPATKRTKVWLITDAEPQVAITLLKATKYSILQIGWVTTSGKFIPTSDRRHVVGEVVIVREASTDLIKSAQGHLDNRDFVAQPFEQVFHTQSGQ